MSDTIKIKVFVRTNKVGSKCEDYIEIDREEWEAMSDNEKDDCCQDVAFAMFEWGWHEVE